MVVLSKLEDLLQKSVLDFKVSVNDLFEKAKAVNSDAQLYKQAGNGVTVPVVYAIGCAILSSNIIRNNWIKMNFRVNMY